MRIIGGLHRGYRFHPPRNNPARPTTDIAKEGLFNILTNQFDFSSLKVLDIFGGTGSISYEFASRGCEDITTVERHYPNVQFIKQTATHLQLNIQVFKQDVFKYIKQCDFQFDAIFAGPPYPLKTIPAIPSLIFEKSLLKPGGWLILEHNPNHQFEEEPYFLKARNYGSTIFSIFENTSS